MLCRNPEHWDVQDTKKFEQEGLALQSRFEDLELRP